ncbi:recombinase family protein [Flindersiella endophytica]
MPNLNSQKTLRAATSRKRAIRYLRVSDPKQVNRDFDPEGISIPAQRQACQRKEKELDAICVDEYVEPGKSATSIDNRPIFREMIARIRTQRDVDYVIVYQLSRFARNRYDDAIMIMTLRKYGVKLISATENIDESPMGEAMHGMIAVMNQYRSQSDGQDVKNKMAQKARTGGTPHRAPLGYLNVREQFEGREVRTIAIDPERAPLVKLAFELYATGTYTIESLRDKLEEMGLRTRGTRRHPTKPIPRSKLGKMLRDRYYIGYVNWNGIETNGRHEPLVSVELFTRVQEIMDAQHGAGIRNRKHNHFLKGLLWCHRCGRRIIVMPGKGNGGTYFYFICRGHQEHLCDLPNHRMGDIERAVEDHFATVVFSEEFREEVRIALESGLGQDLDHSQKIRRKLQARIRELDKKEDAYLDLVGDPNWPKAKLTAKVQAVREERERVRIELDGLVSDISGGKQVITAALDLLQDPQELYRRCGPEEKRLLAQMVFVKLKIDNGEIVDEELAEPFDAVVPAGRWYEQWAQAWERTPEIRTDDHQPTQDTTTKRGVPSTWNASSRGLTEPALLVTVSNGGSSKAGLVPPAGLEPAGN